MREMAAIEALKSEKAEKEVSLINLQFSNTNFLTSAIPLVLYSSATFNN